MLIDFQNSFTSRLSSKFLVKHNQTSHHASDMLLHCLWNICAQKSRCSTNGWIEQPFYTAAEKYLFSEVSIMSKYTSLTVWY